jgi:unsaturated rhamnogalacturonyl hydrolase
MEELVLMRIQNIMSSFFIFGLLITELLAVPIGKHINENTRWSVRMTDSIIQQNPEPTTLDFSKSPRWEYTQGLILKAILQVSDQYQELKYFDYVLTYYNQFIQADGTILNYNMEDYNIDRINPGKPLFRIYQETGQEKYKQALFLLRKQMQTHPRTSEGGFWHKKIYPNQMWLDGLYMAAPYLAQFAQTFNEPALLYEVANQIILIEKHARDEKTGLLYHGWDESRLQRWANPVTGQSPNFWGRSLGWFSMALVDVLDFFPVDHPRRPEIIAILQRQAVAVAKYQDTETGLWYQVVDQGGRDGNYLEASASCMFVYSFIKAAKKNYLSKDFIEIAQKGYDGILKNFIEVDSSGLVHINKVCAVAGLGGDPYRDGSYEYYIHEKIRSDDPKAVGPFILASLEFETLKK